MSRYCKVPLQACHVIVSAQFGIAQAPSSKPYFPNKLRLAAQPNEKLSVLQIESHIMMFCHSCHSLRDRDDRLRLPARAAAALTGPQRIATILT